MFSVVIGFVFCLNTFSVAFDDFEKESGSKIGTTFYVDASGGNDTKDGKSAGNAWMTISKVNSAPLVAGDTVLFKRGEIWRETLSVPYSGSSGSPLTFSAYGTGAKPEINGADLVTGWTVHSGDIWEANVGSAITQLFMDGSRQPLSRWPNSGWANVDADSSNAVSLYSNNLTQADGYWVGCEVILKSEPWYTENYDKKLTIVTNSAIAKNITWDNLASYTITTNFGFVIVGKHDEIDRVGEWSCDGTKVYLRVASGDDPNSHKIEGSVRDFCIDVEYKDNIDINDISVTNAATNGIHLIRAKSANVLRCDIARSGWDGIYINGDGMPVGASIENNTISNTGRDGIGNGLYLDHPKIANNVITDSASDKNLPRRAYGIEVGAGTNPTITGNTIDRVSYCGIALTYSITGAVVSENTITNTMLVLGDGGGIYVWGADIKNNVISNNLVRNVVGDMDGTPWAGNRWSEAGIYLDDLSNNIDVLGNIVYNAQRGIYIHNTHDTLVANNVAYNTDYGMYLREGDSKTMYGNNIYNNIFACTGVSQMTWYDVSDCAGAGLLGDYNYNVHFNPLTTNCIHIDRTGNTSKEVSIATWQSETGMELNGISSDPEFVNGSVHDFHLQSTSPCKDMGKDIGLAHDFDGNPIPYGSAPDIGAYEWGYPSPVTEVSVSGMFGTGAVMCIIMATSASYAYTRKRGRD